ncbi:MAG TPA: two-component regulator propeller domain-containing protein [Flavobacteriales bacterium]|nr:two-component regulator propeller domain-containing protein [Flavobacteriales bacterium]
MRWSPLWCVCWAILLPCSWARAQWDLRFQRITTDDGLTDNAVTCVFEDRAGYIWIGTESGLDRFDGNVVMHMEGAEHHITDITEDESGIFWIATKDHGLLRMEPDNFTVTPVRHTDADDRSTASDQFTCVHNLNDTTLLIGSREASLIFLDKRTLAFSYWTDSTSLAPRNASPRPSISKGWCHALIPLDADHLWVGFVNKHQSLIVRRSDAKVEHIITVRRDGSETQTTALLEAGIIYEGGWQTNIDAVKVEAADPFRTAPTSTIINIPDDVLALAHWKQGSFIAGTRRSGVYLVHPSTGLIRSFKHERYDAASLPNDGVRCLLTGRDGTLWVGTSDGLARYVLSNWPMEVHPLFKEAPTDPPEVMFHRLDPLPDGGALAMTSEGFFRFDAALDNPERRALQVNGLELEPTTLGVDQAGAVLVGTEHGIVRYDDKLAKAVGSIDPFDGGTYTYAVGSMYQVRGIWSDTVHGRPAHIIGTLGYGVHVVDATTSRVMGWGMPTSAHASNLCCLVNSMVRASNGTYWCGSADGLYSWRTDQPVLSARPGTPIGPITYPHLLRGEDVRQIMLRSDTLWGVARSGVLFRLLHGDLLRFPPPTDILSAMHGLAMDGRGRIWITTDDGLLRFDTKSASFIRIPINDGLGYRKLTRAITSLADGRIALCANNALIAFEPEAFDALPSLPLAYLTSVRSAGDRVAVHDATAELSYRSSVIEIGVSALSLRFPEPLLFDYRLEGVEDDWRTLSPGEAIRYAGVPTGSHDLIVRVHDHFGRTGIEQHVLTIHVAGPIWQQWWFYGIALLLATAALYALYRYRLAQAMKLQAVRDRIASDLHDEVGSSLSSITIGSQLASKLSSQENEKVQQIMARIGETSSESLRSISDIVWAIDPKNDQGDALLKRMHRIAQELLEAKGIEVSFSVSGGVEDLRLPMNARKEIVLIYKEAVHNASKYSGAALVQVSLHRRNGTLAVSVKDDGKGFDIALHPDGHGLGSMQRRAASLGCQLQMKSAPGLGTFIGMEVDITRIRD